MMWKLEKPSAPGGPRESRNEPITRAVAQSSGNIVRGVGEVFSRL